MKGQVSIEFFLAAIMAFVAVFWLLNFLNEVRNTGSGSTERQAQLVAAEVASLSNEICLTNGSATFKAPCIVTVNQSIAYTFNSSYFGARDVLVRSPNIPNFYANASTVCPMNINFTISTGPGILNWVYFACSLDNESNSQQICATKNETSGEVRLVLGACSG